MASGVDLVTFSGDKLLGGPQAGIVVGKQPIVARLAAEPLNRALRIDKFTIAALEATLYAYEAGTARETVPTLRMLTEPLASIAAAPGVCAAAWGPRWLQRLGARIVEGRSQVGGGALPTVELPTAALALGATEPRPRALDDACGPATRRSSAGSWTIACSSTAARCCRREVTALVRALTRAAGHERRCVTSSSAPPGTSTTARRRW